jgi:bidirectional [NiFe] hydrogenase diaphorase subunit
MDVQHKAEQKSNIKTADKSGDNRYKLLNRSITKHHSSGNALIEVLHAAQDIFGYLEDELLIFIARSLKLPFSTVYGVATFYHFFRLSPKGEHTFVLCMGTACYVKGAADMREAVEHHCKVKFGETTPDNKVSLIYSRCVGSCGLAPVAVIDDAVVGKLTPQNAVHHIESWLKPAKEVSA